MTINRTTLLNLPLPVTGTESGTWGDTTNNGLTQYIDIAVAGMTSLTSSDFTAGALSLSNSTGDSSATNIAASSAQYGAIKVSSLATNSTITAPSSNRRYVIINADATYNLIIKASGQTGVTVVPGEKALVAFNGTDYVKVGGAAGGSTTQIQFNNAGVFGGSANLTWDGTNVQIGATGALRLADTDSSNYVAFKSPGTVSSNVTWTLPSADGTNGQALTTNGSGTLAFSTISTSAATPTTLGTVYGSMTTSGASPYLTALGYNAASINTGVNNTTVGFESLYNQTSGTNNTALGHQAMRGGGAGITGGSNVGIGQLSLGSITSGANNTAVGYQAGYGNTTANNSTAVGYQALAGSNTNGSNTAVGAVALTTNTSGTQNVAVGGAAMQLNTTGSYNAALGLFALYSNTTASNNTAVGYQAGYSSNATAAPSSIGANTFIGSGSGYSSTSAIHSTLVGAGAGYNVTTGSSNTLVGRIAGYNLTTGTFNTFVGPGDSNSGSGAFITTGSKNTILGAYNGNQDGLDIRTASNYAVISDGDGNRLLSTANGYSLALDGGAVPQSGTGITFPATQSASTDANTLDDYEEGTWTPALKFGGNSTGMTISATGKYTKIGNVVYWTCDFALSAKGSSTGSATITGLPFTSFNGTYSPAVVWAYDMASLTGSIIYRVASNSTTIDIYQYDATGSNNVVTQANFNNASQNRTAGFYFI